MIGAQINLEGKSLPTGWAIERVGAVGKYINGYAFKPRDWGEDGLPIIRIQNLNDETKAYNHYSGRIDEKYFVRNGDILISWSASLGTFLWRGGDAWLNQHIFKAIPDAAKIEPNFFYWAMVYAIERIAKNARGSTMVHVTGKEFLNSEFLLPPKDECKKIGSVLSLVQRAIEQQQRLIALTTELKGVLRHQLFAHGLRRERQRMTEIGPLPESWKLVRCDDLCNEITVGVVVKPASYYVETGIPAFRSLNVREDELVTSDLVYFSPYDNDRKLAKSKLMRGDVLVVRTGYPGTSCVVPGEFDGANCIDLVILRPKRELIESGFLSRFFNSPAGKRQAISSKHGLAQQHLNVGAVKRTLIPVPSRDEQQMIDSALATVQENLWLHQGKRQALDDLFRTLLHQLMTAQTRVNELDLGCLENAIAA